MTNPLPVALVTLDLDVPHLDHPFEYSIPEDLKVAVGSRVGVSFSGKRHFGWVIGLSKTAQSGRKLQPIKKVIGPFPLITPQTIKTAQYLADRYATNLKQVLASALPTRRASVEKQFEASSLVVPRQQTSPPRRSVCSLYPGQMLSTIQAAVEDGVAGQVSAIVVPTSATAKRVHAHLSAYLPDLKILLADEECSDAERYRVHLRALNGSVDVVVGTRSVVWTPMPEGGSIIIWDDGDDRLRERRSPRFDALDVAVARSHVEKVNLLCASYARTVKAQALVSSGWAHDSSPEREQCLNLIPKVRVFDWADAGREGASGRSRFPDAAFGLTRQALQTGRPVLVQVAAAGYETELVCSECGEPGSNESSTCENRCHEFGKRIRVGSDRIRDELSRAFPDTTVLASSSTAGILDQVDPRPLIVVATTSSEPTVEGGYGTVVIAEAESVAYGTSLDTEIEAERRWFGALALAAPAAPAMLIGTVPPSLERAVVRWQPEELAREELATRAELGFPPTRWLVHVQGALDAIVQVQAELASLGPQIVAILSITDPVRGEDGLTRSLVASCLPRDTNLMMASLRKVQVERSQTGASLLRIEVNPTRID